MFLRACAMCHVSPAADSRAPGQAVLASFSPDAIVNALTNGTMRTQSEKLTDDERRLVAEFLTGRAVGTPSAATSSQCASVPAAWSPTKGASWNGWGAGVSNARFQPADKGQGPMPEHVKAENPLWAAGPNRLRQLQNNFGWRNPTAIHDKDKNFF